MDCNKTTACLVFLYAAGWISLSGPLFGYGQSWPMVGANPQQNGYYEATIPAQPASRIHAETISLPWQTSGADGLIGDVLGNGRYQWISCKDTAPFEIHLYDPATSSFQVFPLLRSLPSDATIRAFQLIDYDNLSGLDVLCSIIPKQPNGNKSTYFVFSPQSGQVLTQFQGITGQDQDGDGNWNGSEQPGIAFRATSGSWKLMSRIGAGHADYKPRAVTFYDMATGKLEYQFHVAALPRGISLTPLPSGDIQMLIPLHTPANVIRIDGIPQVDEHGKAVFVSEIVGGIQTNDSEGYVYCLHFNDTLPADRQFSLRWSQKMGELLSGSSSILQDTQGRLLGLCSYAMIRAWDPFSPGRVLVFDMGTGGIVQSYQEGEKISYETLRADPHSGAIYVKLLETPSLLKFDLNQSLPVARRDFETNPLVTYSLVGLTDMNRDQRTDVVVMKSSPLGSELLILDSDFHTHASVAIPLPFFQASIADSDRDGYPECYVLDQVERNKLTVVEYQAPVDVSDWLQYERTTGKEDAFAIFCE
ncbi:MAG: hypothetical protein RBU29_16930 [bacterium]|jgi:hypothetical protein|nr:hypothetical protein [bacterium]